MRSRWLSKRALLATAAVLVWAPGCVAAGWWQVTVALAGNDLGWLYSVEWPALAVFGVVVWWHLVHDDPDTLGARGLRRLRAAEPSPGATHTAQGPAAHVLGEEEDEELRAYNEYLASLRDLPKTWTRR